MTWQKSGRHHPDCQQCAAEQHAEMHISASKLDHQDVSFAVLMLRIMLKVSGRGCRAVTFSSAHSLWHDLSLCPLSSASLSVCLSTVLRCIKRLALGRNLVPCCQGGGWCRKGTLCPNPRAVCGPVPCYYACSPTLDRPPP